ncbi:transglycosylase domain-containing protein [Corynebacterium sp. HS2168-gen11]|uniref:transglycosylase domain-containing protein n=1 Tax=Corynebacterium sp. HS2168-gen11 TaxID=2974027 RepID=UPI00216AFFD2|nr:transglycosylase domain-containing protein [Corynebacterium sp. HS2168-gen11]MCS4535921.1 transglycosylase domain-containing protein [Corynebacterium sp. HS2168-gen11]
MPVLKPLSKIFTATLTAGVASAIALTPLAALGSVAIARTDETMQSNLQDLTSSTTPGVTTITDKNGQPFAWLYDQRRYEVPADAIAQSMKDAIVAIEDRRFYEHNGVDIQGNVRAMLRNILAGGVEQGASTINQQYVKNYLLLVSSTTKDEQQAAIETSIPRKLREMRMASGLDKTLTKDAILTRYLNIIPFGNGAYGIEAAAQTYFGIPASQLNIPQSAMLAGIVQSSSYFNPYTNPEAVLTKRGIVLQAMADNGVISQQEADAFQLEPLGVLEQPIIPPNGCITTGNRGFFCDYVLQYLEKKGLSLEKLHRGAYTIHTTLDPEVQEAAHNGVTSQVDSHTAGAAAVMNIIEPGKDTRRILAMTSSRDYGLDLDAGQTVLNQPATLVGSGAGSIFKIFTAAAALEQGFGLDSVFSVPPRVELQGMGAGGAANCPPNTYCVENAGSYAPQMSLQDALAYSPNTLFVNLIRDVTVPSVVDLSVRLGLRSYGEKGSWDAETAIADVMKKQNLGSYTLGPTAVNPLELSNVAATIASDGTWCEPTPIERMVDQAGHEVFLEKPVCEQATSVEVARALAHGMSADIIKGTAKDAAAAAGWSSPLAAKTGTTESHQSAAFMGFNDRFAAITYIYNDGTTVAPLCTAPLQQCENGNLFGGYEPARSWFAAAQHTYASEGGLAPLNHEYLGGIADRLTHEFAGQPYDRVKHTLEDRKFVVVQQITAGNGIPKETVMRIDAQAPLREGSRVVVVVSDGTAPPVRLQEPPAEPDDTVEVDELTPEEEEEIQRQQIAQLQEYFRQLQQQARTP